jgi:hypothetical protein
MYGGKMCGTVTPPSADCEIFILLASDMSLGRGTTSAKRGMLQRLEPHIWSKVWCVYFVQNFKAKQRFGYAE